MKHFLRCNPEDGQAIELAIETVGRANDDSLTAQLVEFLMGDIDGTPKVGVSLGSKWSSYSVLFYSTDLMGPGYTKVVTINKKNSTAQQLL